MEELEPNILLAEIRTAVKAAPNNKAPGVDHIPADLIKAMGEVGLQWLHRLLNKIWITQETPEDWRNAIIVPIWKKKGSKRDCTKYRGISLLSHTGKIFSKILEKRLRYLIEPQLENSQMGFRKNKSCTEAIFTLRQLVEKTIEFDKELCRFYRPRESVRQGRQK